MSEIFVVDSRVDVRLAVEATDEKDARRKAELTLQKMMESSGIGGGFSVHAERATRYRSI